MAVDTMRRSGLPSDETSGAERVIRVLRRGNSFLREAAIRYLTDGQFRHARAPRTWLTRVRCSLVS